MLRRFIAVLAFPSCLSFAGTIYTDGTFNLANYTTFTYSGSNVGTVGGVTTQCASCGNPGNALSTTVTTTGDAETQLDLGYLNTTFLYNPSTQGAVTSITVSIDNVTLLLNLPGEPTVFDNFLPLIEQDGNYYYDNLTSGPYANPGDANYVTISATLTAANFDQFNATTGVTTTSSHPNFAGDQMEFGLIVYEQFVAPVPGFNELIENDNLTFNVSAAPEPATFALTSAALAALGLFISRRRSPLR
jgi:hypothetical protein